MKLNYETREVFCEVSLNSNLPTSSFFTPIPKNYYKIFPAFLSFFPFLSLILISLQKACETSIQGNSPRQRETPNHPGCLLKRRRREEGGSHAWWSKEDSMLGGQ